MVNFYKKEKIYNTLGLELVLPAKQANQVNNSKEEYYSSTDRDTCIDWCMSNMKTTAHLKIYESWFSDHKPLFLVIDFD